MMKKILSVILLMSIVSFASAQRLNYYTSNLYVGAHFGYNMRAILNQNNYGFSEFDYEFDGVSAYGALIGYHINQRHALQFEGTLSTKGQKYRDNVSGVEYTKDVRLKYVDMAFMYKMVFSATERKFYDESGIKFFGEVGPYVGLLRSSEVEYTANGSIVSVSEATGNEDLSALTDDSNLYNAIEIGIAIGVGVKMYVFSNLELFAAARLSVGLTDLNASQYHIPNREGKYQPSRNLLGGFRFGAVLHLF